MQWQIADHSCGHFCKFLAKDLPWLSQYLDMLYVGIYL
jgi:hypothetical protein